MTDRAKFEPLDVDVPPRVGTAEPITYWSQQLFGYRSIEKTRGARMLTAGHMLYVRPAEGRGLAHEPVYAFQTTIAPHLSNVELHVEWPDAKMSAALRCSIACCEWYCVDTKAAILVRLRGKGRHNQLFALDPHNNATGWKHAALWRKGYAICYHRTAIRSCFTGRCRTSKGTVR